MFKVKNNAVREYLIRNDDYFTNPHDSSISKTVNKVKLTVRFEPCCHLICTSTIIDKKYEYSFNSGIPATIVNEIKIKSELYLNRLCRLHRRHLQQN